MNRTLTMIRLMFLKDGFKRAEYLKNKKVFSKMGDNCFYHPFFIPTESWLIEMGDNVVIAKGVELVTHDMTYSLFNNDITLTNKPYSYYTKGIKIGNNVMIGINSIILPGVTIGNNVVIGGGSVVTKNVPDYKIVAGNPAKIIGDYYKLAEKRSQ